MTDGVIDSVIDAATRSAIGDIVALYCHAIDRRRWALMQHCFHDDASYSFGPIDGSWRDFVAAAQTMIDPLPATHHQLGQTIHAADGAQIRTETYFTAHHRVPADAPQDGVFDGRGHEYHAVIAGRYVDVFALRDGHWRIARRAGVIDWRHDIVSTGDGAQVLGANDPGCGLTFA